MNNFNHAANTDVQRSFLLSRLLPILALFIFAISILSIGITKDWKLVHEEDSAIYTTIALTHNYFGFRETKFHDVFYDRHDKIKYFYLHHPPLASILLALNFRLLHSDAPWAVRTLPIFFHLINLGLLIYFLNRVFSFNDALIGGFIWVLVPMGSFFGRVFTQTVIASLPLMLQVISYYFYKTTGHRKWAALFYFGVIFGSLIDWSPIFISMVFGLFELNEFFKKRSNWKFVFGLAAVGIGMTGFNLAHMYWATNGDMHLFYEALHKNAHNQKFTLIAFVGTVLDFYRRYYTHFGFISSGLVGFALIFNKTKIHRFLLDCYQDLMLERTLLISALGPLVHILASPSYSKVHHYWYFYFMPYAVLSMVIVWKFLIRNINQIWGKSLVGLFLIEFIVMSGYMLHLRHTRCRNYACEKVQLMRENYLLPCSLFNKPYSFENLKEVNNNPSQFDPIVVKH